MKNHSKVLGTAYSLMFLVSSQLTALSEYSQKTSDGLMTKAALSEVVGTSEAVLSFTLAALEEVRYDTEEPSLKIYHKAIDSLWASGRDNEAMALCDELIKSIGMPRNEQRKSLGLAVWKKSLITTGIQESFSCGDKERLAKVSNIVIDSYVLPSLEKKSPNKTQNFVVMLTGNHTPEAIQKEGDIAWEKEVQSWIDAKDAAREALDKNFGSALEKAVEGTIHHMESLYHGTKGVMMELENRFGDSSTNHNDSSGATPEPGSLEDRYWRD